MVERSTADRQVGGSNPPAPSTFFPFLMARVRVYGPRFLDPCILCLTLARYCPRWPGAVQSSSIRARRRVAIEPRGRGGEGARCWIVERAKGRVVSAYWTRMTPEGATSRKRGAESAAGRKLAKCEHRHPWWHLASARTERRAARVKRSAASASMNSHGRENRAGATSLEASVSTGAACDTCAGRFVAAAASWESSEDTSGLVLQQELGSGTLCSSRLR